MICSSQKVMKCDDSRPRSPKDIFVCGSENVQLLEAFQVSKARESSSKNQSSGSSSKLAISSHAETFTNQSFPWFNGVFKVFHSRGRWQKCLRQNGIKASSSMSRNVQTLPLKVADDDAKMNIGIWLTYFHRLMCWASHASKKSRRESETLFLVQRQKFLLKINFKLKLEKYLLITSRATWSESLAWYTKTS